MNKCSSCNNNKFYTLANSYIKCTKCKRKYSLKKIQKQKDLINKFCQNKTALETSKLLKLNYITVSKKFKELRILIIEYLDQNYQRIKHYSNEFDEYIYTKNDEIYKAHNFLTFNYNNYIYNLMLPNLYKFNHFYKEDTSLSKFLFHNKIAKLESKNSLINDFWLYFEEFIKKYKGVDKKNFILYLKESEFKFNHKKEDQEDILLSLIN